jgi:hypothetical protein
MGPGRRGGPERKPWVARITGLHDKLGFERTFLESSNDYRDACKKGRGVVLYFRLERGCLYQVCRWRTRDKEDRYFVAVDREGLPMGVSAEAAKTILRSADESRNQEIRRCLELLEPPASATSTLAS